MMKLLEYLVVRAGSQVCQEGIKHHELAGKLGAERLVGTVGLWVEITREKINSVLKTVIPLLNFVPNEGGI